MKQNSLTDIQKNCAMTKGDVKHVIEALVEEVQENLANGNKVKLNQFGTFYMTFCCPGVATSAECTVKNIKRVNIRFVPDNSHAATRSPANVTFALEKLEDKEGGSSDGGNSGGNSGGDGGLDENPLG